MTAPAAFRLRAWFFTHRVEPDIIVLIDCSGAPGCGAVSVTNDIETVVAFLHESGRLGADDLIVYKDTDERWDGVWHQNGVFLRFELLQGANSHLVIEAMRKLRTLEDGKLL